MKARMAEVEVPGESRPTEDCSACVKTEGEGYIAQKVCRDSFLFQERPPTWSEELRLAASMEALLWRAPEEGAETV